MNTSPDFDFAKILEDSIDDKIKQSREEMQEYHNPIFNQSLLIEIEALEWVQLQIEHLVNSRVKKGIAKLKENECEYC
jgi:hypothetical protein